MLFWNVSCTTTSAPVPKEETADIPLAKPVSTEVAGEPESTNPRFFAIGTVPIKWDDDEPVYRSISVFRQPANLEELIAALTADTERKEAKVLKISPAGESLPAKLYEYVVKEGDTLQSIGKAHSLTEAEIIKINGLKSGEISPGDTLLLPRLD